jgi:hypothetical protein
MSHGADPALGSKAGAASTATTNNANTADEPVSTITDPESSGAAAGSSAPATDPAPVVTRSS